MAHCPVNVRDVRQDHAPATPRRRHHSVREISRAEFRARRRPAAARLHADPRLGGDRGDPCDRGLDAGRLPRGTADRRGRCGMAAGLVAMVLLYRQVRQRQTANRAVRRLEARVSDIVESAMDPIITVDDDAARRPVQRGGREGVPLAAQRRARAAAGHAHPRAVSRASSRAHRALRHDRASRRAAWARQTVLMALRADGERIPDRGLDLAASRGRAASSLR